MKRLLLTSVIVGAIAGLLVGGFHNLFTVPVMERAIVLEEQRSAEAMPAPAGEEGPSTDVSLGVQRIGMAIFDSMHLGGLSFGLGMFAVGFVFCCGARPPVAYHLGSRHSGRIGVLEHFPIPLH